MLGNKKSEGLILLADDQFVTCQQIKMHFRDLGIQDKLVLSITGKEVIDFLDIVLNNMAETNGLIQPISLILLDINMPIMDGLECLK